MQKKKSENGKKKWPIGQKYPMVAGDPRNPGHRISLKTHFWVLLCIFEPFGLYDFLKIWFLRQEIHRSLATLWICHRNHGLVIRHLEIVNLPTKKAHFLPNRSKNRHDRWYWPTANNQCLKLYDHPTTIDLRDSSTIKTSYTTGRIPKVATWPVTLQKLWRPLTIVYCPLSWMAQSKSKKGELQVKAIMVLNHVTPPINSQIANQKPIKRSYKNINPKCVTPPIMEYWCNFCF